MYRRNKEEVEGLQAKRKQVRRGAEERKHCLWVRSRRKL